MKKSDSSFLLVTLFISLFSITYGYAIFYGPALPRYYPLLRIWKMSNETGLFSQGYYGMVLFALAISMGVTVIIGWVLKFIKPNTIVLSSGLTRLTGLTATVITLSSLVLIAIYELF